MKNFINLVLVLSFIFPRYVQATNAIRSPGIFPSPNKKCVAEVDVHESGGGLRLTITKFQKKEIIFSVIDITGMVWLDSTKLVFSVSPIYGDRPGIFLYECVSGPPKLNALIEAKVYNEFYPKGADYFELKSVSKKEIFYYYVPDVDAVDFSDYRSDKNIKTFNLNSLLSNRKKNNGE